MPLQLGEPVRQMYRATKRVTDMEIEMARGRIPLARFEQEARMDLYRKVMGGMVENNLDVETYLLRYSSRRDCHDFGHGREWFTEYELTAIPLEDARAALGGY